MNTEPVIRDATPADAAAIAVLLGELGYPSEAGITRERMQHVVADGNGRVVVAEVAGVVDAVITLCFIRTLHRPGDICRITALVVRETHRGAGLGRRLIEETERHARETGCVRVEVTSAAPREGAHNFYWRLGYKEYPKRFIKDL